MQDKNEHAFQEWEDRGWEEMRRRLDGELPVAASFPGRRLRLMLLAAGFFVVGWMVGRWSDPRLVPAPAPVAVGTADVSDRLARAPVPAGIGSEIFSPPPAGTDGSRNAVPPGDSTLVPDLAVAGTVSGVPAGMRQQAADAILPPEEGDGPAPLQPVRRDLGTAADVPVALPPRMVRLSSRVPVEQAVAVGPTELRKHVFLQRRAICIGGMAGEGFGALGAALGWQWGRSRPGSRWQWEAGIGYSYRQQPLSIDYLAAAAGADLSAAASPAVEMPTTRVTLGRHRPAAPTYSPQALLVAGIIRPLDLHYLELPATVSYRLGPSLSLVAGGTTALLLASRSEHTRGGIFQPGAFGAADQEANFLQEYQKLSEAGPSQRLRVLDVSIHAGLELGRPTGWAARLGWQQGLTDLLPDNGHSGDVPAFLRTSLLYRY